MTTKRGPVVLTLLAAAALARPARATVTEPNGLPVPRPVPQVEIDLAHGFNPPSVVSLPDLFVARGETIDWQKDALTTPSVFSPQCSLTGELVMHGGACHIDFGWYNVDPNRTGPPPDAQITPIILGSQIKSPWHPGVGEDGPIFTTDTIRTDPSYKGGLIGFALKGDPSQDCKQTHFSEQELNPLCSGCTTPGHWAAAVIWQSTKTKNAYYIGFEDLPMGPSSTGPTDFGSIAGQSLKCDGDFNDFIYFLSGVTCEGGGAPCDTGVPGVCAAGLEECVTGTTLKCRPSVASSPEVCDGLDNDCNGMTDDGATCAHGQVCDHGKCIAPCSTTEFPCSPGDTCDNGLCVESACVGKVCPVGSICHGGTCGAPCDGVTCPRGQVCRVGSCVDPCDGVTCDGDRVCDGGVCVAACKCSGCAAGKTCGADGHCREDACAAKTCGATEVCVAGACVDRCDGATCPRLQLCQAGACVAAPRQTTPSTPADASITDPTTTPAATPDAGAAEADALPVTVPPHEKISASSGCRCDAGGEGAGSGLAPVFFALALGLVASRSRRSSASRR
jgi:hypothetical protein